jgi:hypothetical protein
LIRPQQAFYSNILGTHTPGRCWPLFLTPDPTQKLPDIHLGKAYPTPTQSILHRAVHFTRAVPGRMKNADLLFPALKSGMVAWWNVTMTSNQEDKMSREKVIARAAAIF